MKEKIQILPPQPISSMPDAKLNPTPGVGAVEALLLQLLHVVRQGGNVFSGQSPVVVPGNHAISIADLCNQFLESKYKAGRSDNYCRLLIKELRSFSKGRESRLAASVSSLEIETWLHGREWSDRTKKGRLNTVKNIFNYAVSRGDLAANPASGVDVPYVSTDPPQIHTPAQVSHVLETARFLDRNAMRCFALRYFAGLRTSEAMAIEEKEIGKEFIEVTARKSKTRRRRLVAILPALRAWLDLGGVLPLTDAKRQLPAIIKATGFAWPRGVTRHSFVTYHLAEFQNAGKTALQAGHSEQILFNHYRELATPEQAKEFWQIRPK